MSHKIKFLILITCILLVVVLGYLAIPHRRLVDRNIVPDTNTELAFYENKNLHLSFQYPKSFFVREEKQYGREAIILTPLAKDDTRNHSSTGIASAFLIKFYPGENIDSKSTLRTQASHGMGFREEPTIINDISSIHQYYNNAYSGDQNEIWLIPCNKDAVGVFSIGFMDGVLTEQYRSVVQSLKICK